MLYVDIPTRADLAALAAYRDDICVSICLPTTPVSQETAGNSIELKNLAKEALKQLGVSGADKRRTATLSDHLDDLVDDNEFWRLQARSLVILATSDNIRTFRVPNALEPAVAVSDRFDLTPLLRSASFPNVAYVLALSEGAVRLVEVSPDLPSVTVKVDGIPKDAASSVGRASVNDRSPSGRIHGSEGQKVLLRQFARKVDNALRGLLAGSEIPLIIAATEPLLSIYRSVNTYSHLAKPPFAGSPEHLTEAQLAERTRPILDGLYPDEMRIWATRFESFESKDRATSDVAQAARAATVGAVDSLLVNINQVINGTVGEEDGSVTFADHADAKTYGVLGEIAARVIRSGGQVLGVRTEDIPRGGALAAILRYPV